MKLFFQAYLCLLTYGCLISEVVWCINSRQLLRFKADLDQLCICIFLYIHTYIYFYVYFYVLYIYTTFVQMTKGHILRMLAIYEIPGSVLKNHMEFLYLQVPCHWPLAIWRKDHIHRHNSVPSSIFLAVQMWFPHHSTKHSSMGITALNYILYPEFICQLTNTGRDNMGCPESTST